MKTRITILALAALTTLSLSALAPTSADARPNIKGGSIKRAFCTFSVIHTGRCIKIISHGRVRN